MFFNIVYKRCDEMTDILILVVVKSKVEVGGFLFGGCFWRVDLETRAQRIPADVVCLMSHEFETGCQRTSRFMRRVYLYLEMGESHLVRRRNIVMVG
jgi:hypothetical protein